MAELLITLFVLAGAWRVFQKMGRQGWEGIVPFYNLYVLCQELYGQGWKLLLFLVPLYNIYFHFKLNIDLARRFHQGVGFGIGLALLNVVFVPLLGFGRYTWGDGSEEVHGADAISRTLEQFSDTVTGGSGESREQEKQRQETVKLLRELDALRQAGVLTEEEYAAKKAELLKRM